MSALSDTKPQQILPNESLIPTSAWSQLDFFFAGVSSPEACWSHRRRFLSKRKLFHNINFWKETTSNNNSSKWYVCGKTLIVTEIINGDLFLIHFLAQTKLLENNIVAEI